MPPLVGREAMTADGMACPPRRIGVSTGSIRARAVSSAGHSYVCVEGLEKLVLFVGDDWAEDHVRHEALEVERG